MCQGGRCVSRRINLAHERIHAAQEIRQRTEQYGWPHDRRGLQERVSEETQHSSFTMIPTLANLSLRSEPTTHHRLSSFANVY